MFTLANAPQGIGRILDNGFRLFGAGIKGALGIMLIMFGSGLVLGIIASLVFGATVAMMAGGMTPGQMPQMGLSSIVMLLVFAIVAILFFVYFGNAIILNYANIGYQRNIGIGAALSGAFSRLLPATGAVFLSILFLILLIVPATVYEIYSIGKVASGETSLVTVQLVGLALRIPYFFFAVTLSLTIYRAVIDNYGPLSAVVGSHKLVWGKFWRTTLWMLIVYVIVIILFLAIFIPTFGSTFMAAQGGGHASPVMAIIGAVLMIILWLFSMPFLIAMTIPYYHDLKLRKEGGDIESRIKAA